MDYFSCYKLNSKFIPFQKVKYSQKLKDCQILIVIKVLWYSNIGVHYFKKEKKVYLNFLQMYSGKS